MKKLNVGTEHCSVLVCALFVFAVLFVCMPPQAKAQYQPPDSCLKLPIGSDEYPIGNPDSVRVDSCLDSPTYKQYYAKKFMLIFERFVYVFIQRPLLKDSLYTWNDIDSNHNDMKMIFQDIENQFGPYYFKRHYLALTNDSDFIKVPTCLMIFDNYICADTLINYIVANFSPDSINYIGIDRRPATK